MKIRKHDLLRQSGSIFLSMILFMGSVMAQEQGARQRTPQVPLVTTPLENSKIKAAISTEGIASLIDPTDPFLADVISGRTWGRTKLVYKIPGGEWVSANQRDMVQVSATPLVVKLAGQAAGAPVKMEQVYTLNENSIDLDITIESVSDKPVRIGDFAVGLPWRRASGEDPEYIFEKCFTKHHFIAGNGSFVFFTKPSGEPPFIMVLPKKGTPLEYFDSGEGEYKVFVHSEVSGNAVPGGTWRWPHSGLDLGAAGSGKNKVTYGFRFMWAHTWDDMRKILYDEGLIDVRVVPGMTVPTDLKTQVSLHTKGKINSVKAEFPASTTIKYLGEKLPEHHVYEVEFRKLGENMLTVNYGDNQTTYLEFFSTEPVETLIKKRSAFLVNSQQHRDPTKWYNGLYSVYDWKNQVLRGPDNTDGYDGWWGYVLACDDPALGKAPYIAAKNVYFPDDKEIASVEYYLEHFVWNGLQRTDTDDPYPYGVYGVP